MRTDLLYIVIHKLMTDGPSKVRDTLFPSSASSRACLAYVLKEALTAASQLFS